LEGGGEQAGKRQKEHTGVVEMCYILIWKISNNKIKYFFMCKLWYDVKKWKKF
jgi:hypothetical protein